MGAAPTLSTVFILAATLPSPCRPACRSEQSACSLHALYFVYLTPEMVAPCGLLFDTEEDEIGWDRCCLDPSGS